MELRKGFQQLHISAPMINLLLISIEQWINNEPIRFPAFDNILEDHNLALLFDAFSDQTLIGWDHLLCGRLAKSWFTAHDYYFLDRGLHHTKTSKIIGPKIILLLWKFGLSFWYLRNGNIYGTTDEEHIDYHKRQLKERIDNAFLDKDLILNPTDYELLFSTTKEDLLEKNIESQTNWILLYDTCLTAPYNSIPEDNVTTPEPKLHQFFRPYQKFYNKYKLDSIYRTVS